MKDQKISRRDAYIRSLSWRIFHGMTCGGADTDDLREAFDIVWPGCSFTEWRIREAIRDSLRLRESAEKCLDQANEAEEVVDKVMKGIK